MFFRQEMLFLKLGKRTKAPHLLLFSPLRFLALSPINEERGVGCAATNPLLPPGCASLLLTNRKLLRISRQPMAEQGLITFSSIFIPTRIFPIILRKFCKLESLTELKVGFSMQQHFTTTSFLFYLPQLISRLFYYCKLING